MFDDREHPRADRALHAGLRDLPTPETAPDFETRILAALTPRRPWWQLAWNSACPAVPAALCGLTVMLLLLRCVQQTPGAGIAAPVIARNSVQRATTTEARGESSQHPSPESIDSIDLNSASLSFLSHPIRHTSNRRG